MSIVLAITVLAATWAIPGNAVEQKLVVPKAQDKQALRADQVKQLLLLMDSDMNGKISKQEWMKFIEAEFDRLDNGKSGELDVKEISHSKLRASRPVITGK
ncbi:MAG: hypothetical protein ABSG62_08110 [Terracidiphilus sp.]|jgi:hypothetical protein